MLSRTVSFGTLLCALACSASAPPVITDAGSEAPACASPLAFSGSPHAWTTDDGAHYAYAPGVVIDGSLVRMFVCRNDTPYVVQDHVFYEDSSQPTPKLVFGPGASGAWDGFHVCDPSIVKGSFGLAGETYAYAMFYTGNDKNDIGHCQLGVALSKTLDQGGTWVRAGAPVVTNPDDGSWGVGQPSAIDLDGGSQVTLFYTRADPAPHVFVRTVDLKDATSPVASAEVQVSEAGLTTTLGGPDVLTNVDVAVDSAGLAYVVSERHPLATTAPAGLSSSLVVASLPLATALSGQGTWNVLDYVDETVTGSPRNHNAGFARLPDGTLEDASALRLFTSTTCATCDLSQWLFHVGVVEIDGAVCR